MPDAEPKRNWFQFSLRLLILVVVLLVVVVGALYMARRDSELMRLRSQLMQLKSQAEISKYERATWQFTEIMREDENEVSRKKIEELLARLKACGCADK